MIPLPNKKYSVIYADPPWEFTIWSDKGGDKSAQNHYDTMTLEDIKKIDINSISEKNCYLFMWATYPNLPQAFDLGSAWGFKYRTVAFTWAKLNKTGQGFFTGLGYYTRSNPEICLLFVKGKPFKHKSRSVKNLVISPVTKHSQKPYEIRDMIVSLCGDLPRIELFSRNRAEGWDAWGNEVDGSKVLEPASMPLFKGE